MRRWMIIALACCTAALRAQHHDEQRHWSATPPAGWTVMPEVLVEKFNAEVEQRLGRKPNFRYIGGYIKDPMSPTAYPYILVQFTSGSLQGASYADLEREFGISSRAETERISAAFSDIAANLRAGLQKLDRERNRLYITVGADVPGVGAMKGICIGFLGREGIVQFNCYSKAAEFDADLPTYERLVDSFAYDAGYAFTPRGSMWQGILSKAILGAVIGVLLGVVHYFRRKKAAAA